jgi:hypothetical protein
MGYALWMPNSFSKVTGFAGDAVQTVLVAALALTGHRCFDLL